MSAEYSPGERNGERLEKFELAVMMEDKETVAYRMHFVISGTRLPRLAGTAVARSASGWG